MNFKHYDVFSQLVMGYIILFALMMFFGIEYDNSHSVPYIAIAFLLGYFTNTVSSILEGFFYLTIGGRPSDKLLTIQKGKNYTGIRKVKFYEAARVIELLKNDVDDENASPLKMFSKAMRTANSNDKSRVSDFNANYAFSRIVLTTMLVVSMLIIVKCPCSWKTYLILFPLLLSWERFRQRGYYYAKEVLNEYLEYKGR